MDHQSDNSGDGRGTERHNGYCFRVAKVLSAHQPVDSSRLNGPTRRRRAGAVGVASCWKLLRPRTIHFGVASVAPLSQSAKARRASQTMCMDLHPSRFWIRTQKLTSIANRN